MATAARAPPASTRAWARPWLRSSWSTNRRDNTSTNRVIRERPGARASAQKARWIWARAGKRWWGQVKRAGIRVANTGPGASMGNPVPKASAGVSA